MKKVLPFLLTLGVLAAMPAAAYADGYLAPAVGVNFGGDTTKNSTTFGGALGYLGKTGGFEVDFGYTPDFFGTDTLEVDGKVATLMGNFLVGGRRKGASPYLALGAGLIRTNIDGPAAVLNIHETKNNWGGNVGGGLFIGSGPITFRGDVRYFKAFDTSSLLAELSGDKLGFWRGTVGLGFMW